MTDVRLGICGNGGAGKTSLASSVAKALAIPFLEAKSITNPILVRDGYDHGSGVQVEKFLASGKRQEEILSLTVMTMKDPSSFVTDRTVIDLASYAVCELHSHDPAMLWRIYSLCQKHASRYTHLFVCPWTAAVSDNKRRTLNPWYQLQIAGLDLAILNVWGLKYHILTTTAVEDRTQEIASLVKGSR